VQNDDVQIQIQIQMISTRIVVATLAALALSAAVPAPAIAQTPATPASTITETPAAPDYHGKLTIAGYRAGGESSVDVNLRYSLGNWTGWAGYYATEEGTPIRQGRVGIEYDLHMRWLFLVPSVQMASEGFYGGSVYSEIGGPVYVIAGVSRTNLGPYANLTFDPNESWQLGAGAHVGGSDTVALSTIWDNRLDTGQQITHAVVRHHFGGTYRLTVDVSYKSGHGDTGAYLRGDAESIEYDWRRWFVKGAHDRHANFGMPTMWRLGGGMRF